MNKLVPGDGSHGRKKQPNSHAECALPSLSFDREFLESPVDDTMYLTDATSHSDVNVQKVACYIVLAKKKLQIHIPRTGRSRSTNYCTVHQ